MKSVSLTNAELSMTAPGEAVTLAAILAIMAIGIITIVIYKLYKNDSGSVKLPGGFNFSWK